jgi:hypothetical protein
MPKPNALERTIELDGGATTLVEGAVVGHLGFGVEELGVFWCLGP